MNEPKTHIELLNDENNNTRYVLRLYVAGMSAKSLKAIEEIQNICRERLKGNYVLQVIDIYKQPTLAVGDQIIAVLTLIKQLPAPLRRFIGDMTEVEKLLVGLDLKVKGDSE